MTGNVPDPTYKPARYISDSLNNILNVIIMISIVSGIIIDTFGSLREEENEK
jgi:inositol 1,4,5-triphosphate receptor type 1/inositol 1,4,5-triphosphate receptor type 3